MNKMSDKEIISLILRDTSQGMKVLIDRFSPTVYAVVSSRLSQICSHDEVEACVNHVFTEFYFNIRKFDERKCSIKTYLTVMARNKAVEEFRKHTRHITEVHVDSEEFVELPDNMDIESMAENRMLEENLMRAIRSLGTPDSQIIIRKYFYAQTSKQIAQDIGMTDASVRKHISRALAKLRTMLNKSYNVF